MILNYLPKMKRIENPNSKSNDIQSGHRDGIRHRKTCHAINKNQETIHNERIELPNQEKIRMLGEKKY